MEKIHLISIRRLVVGGIHPPVFPINAIICFMDLPHQFLYYFIDMQENSPLFTYFIYSI